MVAITPLLSLLTIVSAFPLVERDQPTTHTNTTLPPTNVTSPHINITSPPTNITSPPTNGTGTSASGDPCAFLNTANTLTPGKPRLAFKPSEVRACLETISFKEEVRENLLQVASVTWAQSTYKYSTIANDADPRLAQYVDVDAEVARIRSTNYDSDYAFQTDLTDVFNRMNDGHAAFIGCYRSWRSTHPFAVYPYQSETGRLEVHFVPYIKDIAKVVNVVEFYEDHGIDFDSLADATITKIDGRDAWDYINNVSVGEAYVYQDRQQRLNSVFGGVSGGGTGGAWGRLVGSWLRPSIPDKDYFELSVTTSDGEDYDLQVPFLTRTSATLSFNYTSGEDYFQQECGAVSGSEEEESYTEEINLDELTFEQGKNLIYSLCPIAPDTYGSIPVPTEYDPISSREYVGGRDVQFFQLSDNKTGVFVIPTFEPEEEHPQSDACFRRFVLDSYFGIKNLTDRGVKRILIDTSNNGGGYIVLGQWLTRFITGGHFLQYNNFDTLLSKTDLSQAITKGYISNPTSDSYGSYSPKNYRAFPGVNNLDNFTDIFEPGRTFSINSHTLDTSDDISDSLDFVEYYNKWLNISYEPPFAPEDIKLTGNGLCGSTCSSFTNSLVEFYQAKAIIHTPQPEEPIEFVAFAASQVYQTHAIRLETVLAGLNATDFFPPQVYGADLSIPYRGGLSPIIAPGRFLQYRAFPAQERWTQSKDEWLSPIHNWVSVAARWT